MLTSLIVTSAAGWSPKTFMMRPALVPVPRL